MMLCGRARISVETSGWSVAPITPPAARKAELTLCGSGRLSVSTVRSTQETEATGTRTAEAGSVETAVTRIRRHTRLPIAVGFGIKTADQAAAIARVADAAVVGSALVETVRANLDAGGKAKAGCAEAVLGLVRELATGVRAARRKGAA